MSDYKMVPVVALNQLAERWEKQAAEHGVRQFTGNDHGLFANELRATIAAAPPFVVTDEVVEKSARVVAERAGVDFDSVDDIVRQVLMDTQRAAIEAVLGGGV